MGCVSSKKVRSDSPPFDFSLNASRRSNSSSRIKPRSAPFENIKEDPIKKNEKEKDKDKEESADRSNLVSQKSKSSRKVASEKKVSFSFKFGRLTQAEHIAAGWPAWLTVVAGEAIQGWVPLRSENFERLEKIGQGTYSSVYRARDTETGRMVALKKVRFDNFQLDSVRFMAREIAILRHLDHPNIMKLEGIITSRLSCAVILVFEYMEHDLSGLLSCPDIKFSEAQIKCYMRQLLCGLQHCHTLGVLHRDIKVSNILVNNEGDLKIADFGLANACLTNQKQQLTSRVVTLWYRPPELLLGATNYGTSVDMWSVGCVFAELFMRRPLLKGRTEVEQLHKIFKLCGSPPEEYWEKSKLPYVTMFKPQHPYESTLRQRCKELPKTAVNLIETLLSMDPSERGTASSALASEYFTTEPCEPSSLPKYPPNKEIDAKFREEARRKNSGAKIRASGTSRNPRRVRKTLQGPNPPSRVEMEAAIRIHGTRREYGCKTHLSKEKGSNKSRQTLEEPCDTVSEVSQTTEVSQIDSILSVPAIRIASNSLVQGTIQEVDDDDNATPSKSHKQVASRSPYLSPLQPSSVNDTRHQSHPNRNDPGDKLESEEIPVYNMKQRSRGRLSGPLLSHPQRMNRMQRSSSNVHQPGRRSRFSRDS